MPMVLFSSLRRSWLRFGLAIPASLVIGGVAAVAFGPLPDAVSRAGWWSLLAGLVLGGIQGAWFWSGVFSLPEAFRDPFARARMRLIALHVSLVVLGMALIAAAAIS